MLAAAAAVAGCHSAAGTTAASPPTVAARPATPGGPAVSGYLHAGRSSVAYLQWSPAGRADLTGILRQAVFSGTPPRQALAVRNYPVAGHIRQGRVLVIRIGNGLAHGTLSGARLTIGPLPGSGLTRTFLASTADGFSRAVAALREQARRSDARTRQLAASATLRRQQAARAVATLITAVQAVRQARRVVSGQLRGMAEVTSLAAVALEKAHRQASTGLARARQGARRVLVCDYAVAVDSDALGVSAYSTGMAADTGSLGEDIAGLQTAISDASGQLQEVLRRQPGYSGGGPAPSPDLVRNKLSQARQRIGAALAEANGYVAQLNQDVAAGYRLSAQTAAARTCRSASPAPARWPRSASPPERHPQVRLPGGTSSPVRLMDSGIGPAFPYRSPNPSGQGRAAQGRPTRRRTS